MGKHANLEGYNLENQQKKSTGIVHETTTSFLPKLE